MNEHSSKVSSKGKMEEEQLQKNSQQGSKRGNQNIENVPSRDRNLQNEVPSKRRFFEEDGFRPKNFDNLKQRNAPRDNSYESDDVKRFGATQKSLKKNQVNNPDHNYDNLIDDSKQVKVNSQKADPSFDQGSYVAENYMGNEIPNNVDDLDIPIDHQDFDDEREVQSDEGPDRIDLQAIEEKVGGFQDFRDLVAHIKGSKSNSVKEKDDGKKPKVNQLPHNKIPDKDSQKAEKRKVQRAAAGQPKKAPKEENALLKPKNNPNQQAARQNRPKSLPIARENKNPKQATNAATINKAIKKNLQLSPLEALIRDLARNYSKDVKFQKEALLHLRSVSESLLISVFTKAYQITQVSGRATLMKRDLDAFCMIINLEPVKHKFLGSNFR